MKLSNIISVCLFFVAIVSASAQSAHAGEINYGSLKEQKGDTLLLEYKGPAGAQYATCTTANSCKSYGATAPDFFPSILGSKNYVKSSDGKIAVKPFALGTMNYYFLYDLSSDTPQKLGLIPYLKPATVYVSKNNNAVVFKDGLTYTRYDIATKALSSVTLPQELSFFSLSPHATYVTGYNYNTTRHEMWRFGTAAKIEGPASMQSYLEFSEDETRIAYLNDVSGFRTLLTMKTSELGKSSAPSLVQVTKPNTETEDYLFVGNTLYFMANVDGPLEWDLFAYDATKNQIARVDNDVSYGDFLKRIKTSNGSQLAYLKTTGKNTNLVLAANPTSKTELTPIAASPASGLTREVKVYGKRTGVLISPAKSSKSSDTKRNLFIWMHGGPQRQVAKGYHSYLSYAVYDELLERLATGGNYVYKIDYTGSTGYGSAFRKALDMKIGDVEIVDIKNAIADIKKDKKIDKVYLIGNSYGGYMALRGIVAMPDTIEGAISIAGVSDWYGLVEQIPSSPFRELFNGVPDLHNLEAYKKASVFLGMEKLTSQDKVLVVWGDLDSTVPVWQSTKYIEYAKTQKASVDSLAFPDEDHILRKRDTLDKLCTKVVSTFNLKNISCSL